MIYSQLSVVWLPQVSKLVTSFCTIRLMTESYESPVSSLSHWQVSTCSSSQPWHPWRMAPPSYPAKLPRHPVLCQTPKWPQDGGQVPLFLVPQSPISTATQVPNPGPQPRSPDRTWYDLVSGHREWADLQRTHCRAMAAQSPAAAAVRQQGAPPLGAKFKTHLRNHGLTMD